MASLSPHYTNQGACCPHPVNSTTWQATLARISLYWLCLSTMDSLCPLFFFLPIFSIFLLHLLWLLSVLDLSNYYFFPQVCPGLLNAATGQTFQHCSFGNTVSLLAEFNIHKPFTSAAPSFSAMAFPLSQRILKILGIDPISQSLLFRHDQNSYICVLILYLEEPLVFSLVIGAFYQHLTLPVSSPSFLPCTLL